MFQGPAVSVVIPTRNRPDLVLRSVQSALAQTLRSIEVIVVIDGPDSITETVLASVGDPRLTVLPLEHSVGGSEARNAGIRKSSGTYIALLDDDDEWAPEKLAIQLSLIGLSRARFPVVTCRLIARRPAGDEMWPTRTMRLGESMSEYLLCRESSIRQGEGFIQTSTLLVPRALLLEVPFQANLPRHQDWDWLIRAAARPDVQFLWAWEPLVIYHIDSCRKSVSAARSVKSSVDWVLNNALVTPKARAYFYATQVAVRCNSLRTFCSIVFRTLRYPRALFIGLGLIFTPRTLIDRLRSRNELSHA